MADESGVAVDEILDWDIRMEKGKRCLRLWKME